MTSGIRKGARTARIVEAIRGGVGTSKELALRFGVTVGNMSSELNRLGTMRVIERAHVGATAAGCPCICWRVPE